MATITTRAGKGSPLTNTEVDDNFTNLNTDKAELSGAAFTGNISTTGTLGIGTTSPASALDVDGTVTISGNGSSINFTGTTGSNFITAKQGLKVDIDSDANQGATLFSVTSNNGANNVFNVKEDGDASFYDTAGTTAKLFWDASAESLGIGTTSPIRALHVISGNDTIRLQSTSTNTKIEMVNTVSTANEFGFLSDSFFVSPNGTEALRIKSSGNVGIGTTSPATALHIDSSGATALTLQRNSGASSNISIKYDGVSQDYYTGVASVSEDFVIGTSADLNGNNLLRVTSAGNLLVGKTSDDNTTNGLVVNSNGYTKIVRTSGTANANSVLMLNRKSTDGSIAEFRKDDAVVGSIGTSGGEIYIAHDGTTDTGLRFRGNGTIIPVNSNGTGANGTQDLGASLYRFKDIHLSGTGYFGTSVGIGTTNPQKRLHVNSGTGNIGIRVESTDSEAEIEFMDNATSDTLNSPRIGGKGNDLFMQTNGVERMRIDSSGNLLVGTTADVTSTNAGVQLRADNTMRIAKADGAAQSLYRLNSNGDIINFYKDGSSIGSIGARASTAVYIDSKGTTGKAGLDIDVAIAPRKDGALSDGQIDLGTSAYRFDDIYATNATIQTSDRNEKQDIAELSDAEQRVAVAVKGLLRKFRWRDAVEEKGDEARIHFGIIAQDLQNAFTAEGLDAGDYAMFINSTWTDEETGEERSRMGVRYSELLAFIISAI